MNHDNNAHDPLDFVRGMWKNMGFSLPGMVTPTLDVNELDKRIADMKAVEGWLKMNLNMMQMTTQGLELQRAALAAVKAISTQPDEDKSTEGALNPFAAAAMWPWNLMTAAQPATPEAKTEEEPKTAARSSRRKTTPEK